MTITRRGFLKSILALGAAPAIVKAESLMRIWTPPQELYVPAAEYAAQMAQLSSGVWHHLQVKYLAAGFSGGPMTRYFLDGVEVAGVEGVSVGKNGQSLVLSPHPDLPGVEQRLPHRMPVGGFEFSTSIKLGVQASSAQPSLFVGPNTLEYVKL